MQDKAVFWCKGCNTDFSFLVRKHHCRHCGHVFCAHCCSNRRAIVKFGYGEPVDTLSPEKLNPEPVFTAPVCIMTALFRLISFVCVQVRLCNKCNGMCFRGDLLLNAVSLNDMQTVHPSVLHLLRS